MTTQFIFKLNAGDCMTRCSCAQRRTPSHYLHLLPLDRLIIGGSSVPSLWTAYPSRSVSVWSRLPISIHNAITVDGLLYRRFLGDLDSGRSNCLQIAVIRRENRSIVLECPEDHAHAVDLTLNFEALPRVLASRNTQAGKVCVA